MTCSRERLSHYHDDELSAEESAEVRAHILECQTCSADLEFYRWVGQQIRQSGERRAPNTLRRDVFQRVEATRRQRARWGGLGAFGPAVPMAAATMLVAGLVGVWKLLPAGSAPVMTAAYTVQEFPEEPDGLRIQLVFDRPIESSSLPGAVSFNPPVEFSQRVIGNKVELIPRDDILPGQTYRIVITNVRDQLGNVQVEPVVFRLTTGATATLEQEPVSPDGTIEEVASDLPGGTSMRSFGATGSGGQALAPSALAQAGSLPVGAPGSTALVTAPGSASMVGKLVGRLFTLQDSLRDRLGAVSGPERLVQLNEQSFQSGLMLYRGDLNQIVVLTRSTGRWRVYPNTWRPGEVLPSSGTRPAGTLDPMRSFGKLWREQPSVKNELGWPVYEERSAVGDLQPFDRGTVVRSAYGLFYVLYADGSWRTFVDPSRP